MTEAEGLLKIRDVVGRAMEPDSGATLQSLMGDALDVLVDFDLDPVAAFEVLGDDLHDAPLARRSNVIPLCPGAH